MSIKCTDEKKEEKKSCYIPHKLRSRPLRCISLPLCCLFLFIIYWFILCPLLYVGVRNECKPTKCNLSDKWPWYFWIIALIIFIVLLSIILCVWCCKPKKKVSKETEERQKEYHKLLKESFDYNSVKEKPKIENANEKIFPPKIIKKFDLDRPQSALNKIKEEELTEKQPTTKKALEAPIDSNQPKPQETMVEEIDKMFPRCSIRRKDVTSVKKRPETLVLQSPKYPMEPLNRHTLQEEVKAISPLTPREIFFYDLFKSAHLQLVDRTAKFIENEKKHSSNNFFDSQKPEVTDFVLKQKPSTDTSGPGSPEFFIANVSPHTQQCTSETFMYVEGGQSEEALTICYLEKDEVFTP